MSWKFIADWDIQYGWQETGLTPVNAETFRIDQTHAAGKAPYQARLYILGELGTDTLGLFPLQPLSFAGMQASTVFELKIPADLKAAGFHFRRFAAMHNPSARRLPNDNWQAALYYWQP
jgi:hypothetical protein